MHIWVSRWPVRRHLIRKKAGSPVRETAAGTQVEANTTVKYWVEHRNSTGYDPGSGWPYRN